MNKIAVLIPCFNEEKTISKVVKDFRAALPEAVIYVYDNNSSDDTAKLAREAGAVVRHEYRQGKGNVIRRMFREIDARCYIITDGDDTYPAESAPEMAERVLNHNADMVVGDRLSSTYFTENRRLFHSFGNRMVRKLIQILFNNDVKDIMTGYRAFSYQFVKSFPVLSEGFEIETEMSIHAMEKNMAIENVVIPYRNRPEGSESKLNTYTDGRKILRTLFRLFVSCHPMMFFGGLSVLLCALSAVFCIIAHVSSAQTNGTIPFATLIVCGLLVIAGIQSFFSGLILKIMIQKSRQEFEIRLYELAGQLQQAEHLKEAEHLHSTANGSNVLKKQGTQE